MTRMRRRNGGKREIPKFKSQPWTLFDTVAARSFMLGDATNGKAFGSDIPAINAQGEINFFQASGRTAAQMPWYSNLDVAGQLAYGLQVWQVSVEIFVPAMPQFASRNPNAPVTPPPTTQGPGYLPPTVQLAQAILQFGSLQLNLGQEQQIEWPLTMFGAGGGLSSNGMAALAQVTNGQPFGGNTLKLPEPIEMGRTQNISAKIRLASEILSLIGTEAAPGVGAPLLPYSFDYIGDQSAPITRPMPPYEIRLKLAGRRIKDTQYGQVVR